MVVDIGIESVCERKREVGISISVGEQLAVSECLHQSGHLLASTCAAVSVSPTTQSDGPTLLSQVRVSWEITRDYLVTNTRHVLQSNSSQSQASLQ